VRTVKEIGEKKPDGGGEGRHETGVPPAKRTFEAEAEVTPQEGGASKYTKGGKTRGKEREISKDVQRRVTKAERGEKGLTESRRGVKRRKEGRTDPVSSYKKRNSKARRNG